MYLTDRHYTLICWERIYILEAFFIINILHLIVEVRHAIYFTEQTFFYRFRRIFVDPKEFL